MTWWAASTAVRRQYCSARAADPGNGAETPRRPARFPRRIPSTQSHMNLQDLTDAVISGDAAAARELTESAIREGADPTGLVEGRLIPAMGIVGGRFGRYEIYIPEMLLAARAMQASLEVLDPLLAGAGDGRRGRVVIGTVAGDVHDLGKNIVAATLKGSGFAVHDLGVDVASQRFVEAVAELQPDILALSALLTTTLPAMDAVVRAVEAAGLRDRVKVMVGGAPVTADFAGSIGADGYGRNAGAVAELAGQLLAASR